MENEISETKKKWGIKPIHAIFVGAGILVVALISLFGLRVLQTKVLSKQFSSNLPRYGWRVTKDLGIGEVPGGPTAQRFQVDHFYGWEVLAYCLDPQKPPPPMGTLCELMNGETFWCGDEFQQLREYEIVQQPPSPTRTNTTLPRNTRTATPTSTSTSTPTSTMTPTATNTATPTRTRTNTPTNTSTKAPGSGNTSTPTPRPKMGGGGNFRIGDAVRLTLGIIVIGIGVSFAAMNWKRYFRKLRKK